MDRRSLTIAYIVRRSGERYETVSRYYDNKVKRIELESLTRIAIAVGCNVSDLYETKIYNALEIIADDNQARSI